MAIDYGDMFNRYAQARMDQATQPFNDPEAYFNKRLENQYGVTLDEQGNVKPRSTTITNNDDGSQTVTTKHEITPMEQPAPVNYEVAPQQAAPSGLGLQMPQAYAQPMAPVAQPVAPAPVAQPVAQPMPQESMMARPEVAPAPAMVAEQPEQAVRPVAPVAGEMPNIGQPPMPGPGVQLAGPMVQGAVPNAPSAAPQPNQAPVPAVTAQPPVAVKALPQSTVPQWAQDLQDSQGDITRLHAVAGNKNYPDDVRAIASQMTASINKGQLSAEQAGKQIENWLKNPDDTKTTNTVMKELRKEDGSYIKAYLFKRLGFDAQAQEEMDKLHPRTKIEQAQVDGKHFTVEKDSQGAVTRAWDENGTRQKEDSLAKIQAAGLKTGTHAYSTTAGSFTIPPGDPNAGQEYRQQFNAMTGGYKNVISTGPNAGQEYRGAPGFEKRVETNAAVKLNDAYVDYKTKPTIAMATTMLEMAGKIDDGGKTIRETMGRIQQFSPEIFNQVKPLINNITGGSYVPPESNAGATKVTGGAPAPAGNRPAANAPANAPVNPNAPAPTGGGTGGSLLGREEAIKTQAAIATAGGSEEAKKVADIRVKLPTFERSVDNTLYTLNDVLTHPGFSTVVGKPDLLTAPISQLPSSDMRDFRAKFSQLKAQQFLNAFDQLRGAGSITEKEGDTATAAVSALQDTGISQDSFRKNAWILKDTLQRGIDTQREQVGKPPKYVSTDPKIEQARQWVRMHPNDPKVLGVIKTLQSQGF